MKRQIQLKWLAGLMCVIAGSTVFILSGCLLERGSPLGMCDFFPVYYHARVVLEHGDPYIEKPALYERMNAEGFLYEKNLLVYGLPIIPCVYPPSSLLLVSPLAHFRWQPAHLIWMVSISASLSLSTLLIWLVASENAPLLAGVLLGFFLANSATVLFEGNSAGIAVSLCMIAAWCFIQRKQPVLGSICLAISLALKPHDAGLIWACFLFSEGVYRKRALQTLIPGTVLLAVAAVWVAQVSPHWPQEMASNIASISGNGGVNDPGPGSATPLIVNSAINAQTVFAVFRNNPTFYNLASYICCGVLLLGWFVSARRLPVTAARMWLSLAFISAVSMLPVYHRHHDAKLLMLAVPACAVLWVKHRVPGIMAVLFTALAMLFNADLPRAILTILEGKLAFSNATFTGKLMTVLLQRPAPVAIMAMAIFFLWAHWRLDPDSPQAPVVSTASSSDTIKFAMEN